MQDALTAIKGGGVPGPEKMTSLDKLKEILGFHVFYEEEKRYVVKSQAWTRQQVSPNTSPDIDMSAEGFIIV